LPPSQFQISFSTKNIVNLRAEASEALIAVERGYQNKIDPAEGVRNERTGKWIEQNPGRASA
jgi:hypothetical protein